MTVVWVVLALLTAAALGLVIFGLVTENKCWKRRYLEINTDYNKKLEKYDKLELFVKELSYHYKNDGTCPSILLSFVPQREQWYLAVVRYLYPMAEGKRTVSHIYRSDIVDLIDLIDPLKKEWEQVSTKS